MSPEQIKQVIEANLADCQVEINGADCNFSIIVTSADFVGKSLLQRERMVTSLFKEQIESGALHAMSVKTKTP